jgi:hypothetical protein
MMSQPSRRSKSACGSEIRLSGCQIVGLLSGEGYYVWDCEGKVSRGSMWADMGGGMGNIEISKYGQKHDGENMYIVNLRP